MKTHFPSSSVTRFSEGCQELAAVPEIPALTILCHPDVRRVGERAPLHALTSGDAIELSRHGPLFAALVDGTPCGLGVSYVSRKPLRLAVFGMGERLEGGAQAGFLLERCDSSTPVKVDGQPLGELRRFTAADVQRGVVLELGGRIVLLFHRCPSVSDETPSFGLVGESAAMQRLRKDTILAASTDTPVLLRGASGTGKELVARAVHDSGERRGGPWVAVNMAAIPPSLAVSELFGSRKGAFTGADRKDGYFLAANGGTLFLDEIGDTPAEVQPLLLRALESGEIQPVGSAQSRRVDVRVLAATDADLEARLAAYDWPGNVRQLANVARRLAIAQRAGRPIGLGPFVESLLTAGGTAPSSTPTATAPRDDAPQGAKPRSTESGSPTGKWRPVYRKAAEVSEDELVDALRAADFELTPAAEALGVSRPVLYQLIEKCPRVRKAADLGREEIEQALASAGDEVTVARVLEVSLQGLRLRMKALGLR